MEATMFFKSVVAMLMAAFLYFGMDVRRKAGTQRFVAPVWQTLMKFSSFALIVAVAAVVIQVTELEIIDWVSLSLLAVGTAFVVAAKYALGMAHTFTGQYLEKPQLVVHGAYAVTRNPLYFGVFVCEFGASLFLIHQLPMLFPQTYAYYMSALAAALAYAVAFNWKMAMNEAHYLQECFGDVYRQYQARVPFLIPFSRLTKRSLATTSSAPHVLQKRPFRLDASEALVVSGAWYDGKPFVTQLLNAYTLLIPEGEHFVIRNCAYYQHQATPALKEELRGLFFQEGQHAREHRMVLKAMRTEGLSLDFFCKPMEWLCYRLLEPISPRKLRLATAAAIELHNAVIATYFLNQALLRGIRGGALRRLFLWHFAEEIEHKETVFKLLQGVSHSWSLRAVGLMLSLCTFLMSLAIGTLLLTLKTGSIRTVGFWRDIYTHCVSRTGLVMLILKESVHYLRPEFAPSLAESQALLDSALAELKRLGVEQPKTRQSSLRRALPVAFRDRVRPSLQRVRGLQRGNAYFGARMEGYDGAWVYSAGTRKLNFCTYSYLGLLGHSHIDEAAKSAIERYGTGTHGVRLLGGNLEIHEALEAKFAAFFDREAAITFSSGFVTNLAVIAALVGRGDYVLCDKRNHASIVDGCRLSGAEVIRFRHNDIADLEKRLCCLPEGARKLIVVDAVYSMDGDIAPLERLIALRDRYPNTLLMVDEAHSLGVLGERGRGIEEHFGCHGKIDVLMGTLSKTIPAQGGYIAGSRELITYLRFNARGFVFSAALAPATAAAALAALELIEREGQSRRAQLMSNVSYFVSRLRQAGFNVGNSESAIVPILLGSEGLAFDMARSCNLNGLYVMPVAYPAVAHGAERLRLNVTCSHSRADLDFAIAVLMRIRASIDETTKMAYELQSYRAKALLGEI